MTISLAFLAPNLVKAAVEGRLPRGIGVERLRDPPTEWSRQFEALGLNPEWCSRGPVEGPDYGGSLVGIPLGGECSAVQLRAQPPGTEFLDAETKRQKSSFKRANARRDENPRVGWPEIPAKTPYLASYRKRAVCKGWVVGAPGLEPGTR
jgi:hypothetical protein